MLSNKHLIDVCLADQNSHLKCRYLAEDEKDYGKFYCLKKSIRAKEIDLEVNDFLLDLQRRGKSPEDEKVPVGNNCSGYLFLRHKEQGYDKKD